MKMVNLFKSCAVVLFFLGQAVFAQSLSKSCIQEFANLPKTKADFNVEEFMKGVPAEVAKVKAQMKLPFGKPADSKKTDIGITVGCLKQFPESADAIAPMLKDLSLEITKNMVASGLNATTRKDGGAQQNAVQPSAAQSNIATSTPQNSSEKKVAEKKDIIYLRNGQEIKDATVTEIAADEVKYKIGARIVAYVSKKTDISSILYADGERDFFCNGISYNSATHFCHTDGQMYSCGNNPYNPVTQSCSGNAIYAKCNNKPYNIATHFCHTDGQTYSCGNNPYNPATHFCSDNVAYAKCGDKLYVPATQFCFDNAIYTKCGDKVYNPVTQVCASDNNIYAKCGNKAYNSVTHFCFDDAIYAGCDGKSYNPKKLLCFSNTLYAKCGNNLYNFETQFCFDNAIYAKCGDKIYDPTTLSCSNNTLHSKCGDKIYNPETNLCEQPKNNRSESSKKIVLGFSIVISVLATIIIFVIN